VVANENLRRSLAAAARKQAVSEFAVQIYRDRIEQVLRKVLLNGKVGINATLPEVQRTASELQV
jgi:hypothetical protein